MDKIKIWIEEVKNSEELDIAFNQFPEPQKMGLIGRIIGQRCPHFFIFFYQKSKEDRKPNLVFNFEDSGIDMGYKIAKLIRDRNSVLMEGGEKIEKSKSCKVR